MNAATNGYVLSMHSKIHLIAPLLVATLAGCGSTDNSQSESQQPQSTLGEATATQTPAGPTKDEFIAQADQVCADFREATKEVAEATPSDYDELEEQAQEIIQMTQATLAEFRALTPPAGDDEIMRRYTSSVEESITLLKRLREAAQEEDAIKVDTYADDLRGLSQRQRGLAQGYGFKVCGTED